MINIIGTSIVIIVCLAILLAMYLIIRMMQSDSAQSGFWKDLMDILGSMQRQSGGNDTEAENGKSIAVTADQEKFEEECPACSAKVTQKDVECPSCGLRLL
jgi:DNA-directed RNA polymerase subunit RPC12/RpoP